MMTLALFGVLLLAWQVALQAFAWGLGSRLHWAERLAACAVVLLFCSPWIVRQEIFLPLDETIAREVPGAGLPAAHGRHGADDDVVLQLYPWEAEVRSAWRAGRLPFWSDLLDGGSSPWTNPQAAVLAPTAILARLGPLDQSFLLHFALKAVTAILGALVLAPRLGLGRVLAWLAALAFGLGGGVVAWGLYPLGTVVAWMPWLTAAAIVVSRSARHRRRAFLTAALLAASVWLSGPAKPVIAAALISLASVVLTFRRRNPKSPQGPRQLARTATIVAFWLLGGAFAAPVLLPQAFEAAHSSPAGTALPGHPPLPIALLALILAILAILPLPRVRGVPVRSLLAIAALSALIPWAWDYLPAGHREMLYPVTPFVGALAQQMELHPGARVTAAGFLVYPSLLPVYGFPEVRVNNPAADVDYLRVLDACLGFRPEGVRYKGAVKNPDHPILSFLGVAVLIAGDHTPQPARWKRLDQGQLAPLRLYENPNPLPRWFLPIGADVVPAAARLAAVAAIADPRRVVLSAEDANGWQPSVRPWRPLLFHATGVPGRVHLEFPGDAKKVVASSLPFSTGWRATAGGRPMSTIRVDGAFLGLVAEPGITSADVRFVPPGFRPGLALAALALLLGGLIGFFPRLAARAPATRTTKTTRKMMGR